MVVDSIRGTRPRDHRRDHPMTTAADILTIVDTGNDDETAIYVNGRKKYDVHCNDTHEIPDILYGLMVKYNFATVKRLYLTDSGYEKYEENYSHPDELSGYSRKDYRVFHSWGE